MCLAAQAPAPHRVSPLLMAVPGGCPAAPAPSQPPATGAAPHPDAISPSAAGGLCCLQIRAAGGSSGSVQRQVSTPCHRHRSGGTTHVTPTPPVPHVAASVPCGTRTEPGTTRVSCKPGSQRCPWARAGRAWHWAGRTRGCSRWGGCCGETGPRPPLLTPVICLLPVTAECMQRQTRTTTLSAPPPRTASAPW